jgi:hypothetical protein
MTDLNRHEICSHCHQWVHTNNSFVVVDDHGKRHYLHNRPCRDRYFDDRHGTVVEEYRQGRLVFQYRPEMEELLAFAGDE